MNKGFVVLIVCAASFFLFNRCKRKIVDETHHELSAVLIIDPSSSDFFEKTGAMMKYMTDEGIAVTEYLTKEKQDIIIPVDRDYIEVAFQDNKTISQYFVFQTRDTITLSSDGENFILSTKNQNLFPFDEAYPYKRNSILFKNNEPGIDKFFQMTRLLTNSHHIDLIDDDDIKDKVSKLKEQAYVDFNKESGFLDSLQNDSLISVVVAEFYRLKIAFDKVKISSYNGPSPSFDDAAFLLPFELAANTISKHFNNWRHLTFYDDWITVHCNSLYAAHRISRMSLGDFDQVYTQIKEKAIPSEISKALLLKNVMNACDWLTAKECKSMISRFSEDSNDSRLEKKLEGMYKTNR